MSYPHTDVLLVDAGCGATTAAEDFPNKYVEAKTVNEAMRLCLTHSYRYVLMNTDKATRDGLDAKQIDYVIVAALPGTDSGWVERWLRAGSSGRDIKKRLEHRAANSDIHDCGAPIAYISTDKWFGQMMEQSRASAEDGKDV